MHFPRIISRSLIVFSCVLPGTLLAFTLSSDFSKDTSEAGPEGAVLSGTNAGSVIKIVDSSTAPEDPFGGKGNKSLLFEKNEEGVGVIPKAQWENLPSLTSGKLTFTVMSVKEAAGIFTVPAFFAIFSESGRNGIIAGFGGNSIILMDGSTKVIVKEGWLHNEPNVVSISFSVPNQTYSITVNGEVVKSEEGKSEFSFKSKIKDGFNEFGFSVADASNRTTRVFVDKFELTDAK